jgi:uracil-DNA glycosylase
MDLSNVEPPTMPPEGNNGYPVNIANDLPQDWKNAVLPHWSKEDREHLQAQLDSAYKERKIVFPLPSDVLSAFRATPFSKVRVVILGQDPYHGPGQAHGLSFSVKRGVKVPPSLVNIYTEMTRSLKSSDGTTPLKAPNHGNLEHLSKDGVLLLNTALTVEAGNAGSHGKPGWGWAPFTTAVLRAIGEKHANVVFLLWGKPAEDKIKKAKISAIKHKIYTSPHPSPLSAHLGFSGNNHFYLANEYIRCIRKEKPIEWIPGIELPAPPPPPVMAPCPQGTSSSAHSPPSTTTTSQKRKCGPLDAFMTKKSKILN